MRPVAFAGAATDGPKAQPDASHGRPASRVQVGRSSLTSGLTALGYVWLVQGGQGTKLNQPDYLCRRVLASKANDTSETVVLSDWIAASKTNIYALGCVEEEDLLTTPWTNFGNQVPNGNMEIVNGLPGQPGCVVFNAGCTSMWGVMPGTFDYSQNRTIWTDGRAKVHISTVSPHRGRHSLRINSPKPRQILRVGIPGDGVKGYNLSTTHAAGQLNVPNCLFNHTRYELEAYVRASRCAHTNSWICMYVHVGCIV